jgi:hypothetical protein
VFTGLKVVMSLIDDDGKVISDPETKYYRFCWERKVGGLDWLPSEDGATPMDGDVGDEGNFVVPADPGKEPLWYKDSGSYLLVKSIEDCGLPVPESGDWSEWNGLEGFVSAENTGRKYTNASGNEVDEKVVVFKKVMSDSVRGGKTKAKAKAKAGKASDESPETAAVAILEATVAKLREQGKDTLPRKSFVSKLSIKTTALQNKSMRGEVEKLFSDDEWLQEKLSDLDAALDGDELTLS